MAREKLIVNTKNCNRCFRAFCKMNGLKDGDFYEAVDYMRWLDDMQTMALKHISYTNYEETEERIISWIEKYVDNLPNELS